MSQKSHRISLQLLILTAFASTTTVSLISTNAAASSTFTTPKATLDQDSSYHKDFNKNLNKPAAILTQSSQLKDSASVLDKLTNKRGSRQELAQLPQSSAERSERADRIMERLRERRISTAKDSIVIPTKQKEFSRAAAVPIYEARPSAPTASNNTGGRFIYTDQQKSSISAAVPATPVTAAAPATDAYVVPTAPFKNASNETLRAIEPAQATIPIAPEAITAPPLFEAPTYALPSPNAGSVNDSSTVSLSSIDALFGEESMQPITSSVSNLDTEALIQPALPVETSTDLFKAPQLSATTPSEPLVSIAANTGLSEETKEILYSLPEKITGFIPKREKSGRFAIKRELAAQAALQSSSPSDSSDNMNISVKKRTAINYDRILEQAFDALAVGNTQAASALYKDVIEAEPKNIDARFGIATTYHRLGMLEEARNEYGFLLHQQPDHLEGLNNFLALVGEESPVEAVKYLSQLAERNPDYSPLWAQVSGIYQNQGDVLSAIEAMERARAVTPENIVYSFNLAVLYDESGQGAKASGFYRTVLSAAERGQPIPVEIADVQNRLTYLSAL